MIYENPINFKKLVRSDSKGKFYYKKTLLKVLFFESFKLKKNNNVFSFIKHD